MATKNSKKKLQFWGTGRRKKAVARVRIMPGSGAFQINKRSIDDYFGLETLKLIVNQPLVLTETAGKLDIFVNVRGGGYTGQAGAVRHGIARALVELDEANKGRLPYARPPHEGAQKVRSQESAQSASVLEEIIVISLRNRRSRGIFRGILSYLLRTAQQKANFARRDTHNNTDEKLFPFSRVPRRRRAYRQGHRRAV